MAHNGLKRRLWVDCGEEVAEQYSSKAPLNQDSHRFAEIVPIHRLHPAERSVLDSPRIGLTLIELETIIPHEYGPLIPWVTQKLRVDYGVRDLPHPTLLRQRLHIVAPIAEELVHDTIADLWVKIREKKVHLDSHTVVRRWLKGALKIALRQWAQQGARTYKRRVYGTPMEGEDQDPMCPEAIEPWDMHNEGSIWQKLEAVFDRLIGHHPSTHSDRDNPVKDELNAALKCLPSDVRKLIDQVYWGNVSWKEASASRDVDCKSLEQEVRRWLRTLKPYIPSYQRSHQLVTRDTRRVRKSFHCPWCDKPIKRQKGNNGGGCTICQMRIHKEKFVIRYYYYE